MLHCERIQPWSFLELRGFVLGRWGNYFFPLNIRKKALFPTFTPFATIHCTIFAKRLTELLSIIEQTWVFLVCLDTYVFQSAHSPALRQTSRQWYIPMKSSQSCFFDPFDPQPYHFWQRLLLVVNLSSSAVHSSSPHGMRLRPSNSNLEITNKFFMK